MEEAVKKTIKIAVVGPESSGKSTLAEQLSKKFSGSLVKEFARTFLEKNGGLYTIEDLNYFAKKQLESEEKFSDASLIFCDTIPLSIRVWSLYKYGKCSKEINSVVANSEYHLHLLLKPDLPYQDDPLREDSPLKNRIELFNLFDSELKRNNQNYIIVEGQNNFRLNNAIGALNSKFSF